MNPTDKTRGPETKSRRAHKEAQPTSQDINDQKHNITLPLDLSLALKQAVFVEQQRRAVQGIKGRVSDSTIIRELIRNHLPPCPKY